jgi:hypothetical protein
VFCQSAYSLELKAVKIVDMTKKPTGRPSVMTATTVQKLETALRDGFSVEMACHVSGVGRSTYYQHLQSDIEFADKMELAQDWITQRAKQVVAQAIDKGDLKMATWWLERRARAEFAANPPVLQGKQNNLNGWLDGGQREEKLFNLLSSAQANLP